MKKKRTSSQDFFSSQDLSTDAETSIDRSELPRDFIGKEVSWKSETTDQDGNKITETKTDVDQNVLDDPDITWTKEEVVGEDGSITYVWKGKKSTEIIEEVPTTSSVIKTSAGIGQISSTTAKKDGSLKLTAKRQVTFSDDEDEKKISQVSILRTMFN